MCYDTVVVSSLILTLAIAGLPLVEAEKAPLAKLVTPKPSREALELKAYLDSVYGKKIISGQCDDKYLPYIKETTGGKEPAIMGYDLNGICPGQRGNQDAVKAIKWVTERGGIATYQWHWITPDGKGDFYSKEYKLGDALKDPKSEAYKQILRDIDLAAAEFKTLQKAKVPVLWRPLHEAEGKWFWWGMAGGDACKTLYRLIFDRMTKHHKLDNLIWVWTSYGKEKENWYPGDDVVDLIVWDYETPNSWNHYQELFGGKGKMFGLGEEGKLPDPANFQARPWLYFLTWAYMIEDPEKGNSKEWVKKVYNDPLVVTLSDLPKSWIRKPVKQLRLD